MTELARGAVSDRPWGRTLGALGMRGLTGQLTLTSDGKPYRIAFHHGAVVGASSPLASDAAVRIALTGGLITSTQVSDITRRIASSPHRDEVEVLAEVVKLSSDHASKLRRRLVAQRAARTFAIERGDFVIEDRVDVPVVPGSELDIRAVIYLGARTNLTEDRLANEVATLGGWFQLKPAVVGELAQFGFTESDKPVLQQLIAGSNLAELEVAANEGVGSHGVRAIVYALVSCNACEVEAMPRPVVGRPTLERMAPRTTTPPIERRIGSTTPPIGIARRVGSTTPPIGTERRAGTTLPPRAARTSTNPPRDGVPVRDVTPRATVDLPEGMQLRSPTGPPPTTSSTRTTGQQPTVAPPTRTTGQQPTVAPPVSRTATPVTSRTPTGPGSTSPAVGRAPSNPTPTGPVQPRTTTGAGRTPPSGRTPTNPTPTGPMQPRTTTGPTTSRTATPTTIPASRTPTPTGPTLARSPTNPTVGRAATPTLTPIQGRVPTDPSVGRTPTPSDLVRSRSPSMTVDDARRSPMPRVKRNTAAAQETESLIRERLALLDRGTDHFLLLGITQDASADVTRAAYFTLARKLHPDRLASLGIADAQRDAQRLFAQINTAFAILNDPVKRLEYMQTLGRGGESAVRAEDEKATATAMRAMHGEEAFRRGEMALRREQLDQALQEFTTALELQPTEPEYIAMLAWTKFAASTDKASIAAETRGKLTRAADQSDRSPAARFYLGRVERILGREREALSHFQEVLRIKPNHAEASSEIRVLEARLRKR
ncbi:MAG TPA: DnaJ domain-containing protein [Kofleriaceae bacterium]